MYLICVCAYHEKYPFHLWGIFSCGVKHTCTWMFPLAVAETPTSPRYVPGRESSRKLNKQLHIWYHAEAHERARVWAITHRRRGVACARPLSSETRNYHQLFLHSTLVFTLKLRNFWGYFLPADEGHACI